MQILSVTLKNFKIHRDRHFDFQAGVNAICGENGAGKTSILEAIAWVLFDYSSGYNKDELRYQDAKSAEVVVSIISSHDGRTYTVQRETAKGRGDRYRIFDPQLNRKLDDLNKIEAAQQWLREHLGIPKGTDLSKLFADVIGIPQGTFTLDFLKSATERRKVFDPILKVEAYKQAFKASSDLETYAKTQTQTLQQTLENYRDRLTDWEQIQEQYKAQRRAVDHTEAFLRTLAEQLAVLEQDRVTRLEQVRVMTQLEQQVAQLTTQQEAKTEAIAQQQQLVHQAQAAQSLCEAQQTAFEGYQKAETQLQQLRQQEQERAKLQHQQTQAQKKLMPLQVQAGQLDVQLAEIEQAQQVLQSLQPQIQTQLRLEAELQQLQTQVQQLQAQRLQQASTQKRYSEVQTQIKTLTASLEQLRSLAAAVETVPTLENQVQQLQTQLGQVSAAQQFQEILSQLTEQTQTHQQQHQRQVKPVLKAIAAFTQDSNLLSSDNLPLQELLQRARTALESGLNYHQQDKEALELTFAQIQAQANDKALRLQLKQLQTELKARQRDRLAYEALPEQEKQLARYQAEWAELSQELTVLDQALAAEPELQQHIEAQRQTLAALEDPRGRARYLETQCAKAKALQTRRQALRQEQTELERAIAQFTEQLQCYGSLDTEIQTQTAVKQRYQAGYQQYLQQQNEAQALPARTTQLQTLEQEQTKLRLEVSQVQQALADLQRDHDPETLAELERDYSDTKAQRDQLAGALPGQQQELTRLGRELEQRQDWLKTCDRLEGELQQKQQVQQFIADARRIYNQSGPRITQFYLNEIVREGDRLFRELMNRQNMALNWTEDYEIQIQEGAVWRNFKTLSGGEQMAAALAIRLALLKVLADFDIAFFDEPTTNMDRPRREQLAEALANLKAFRQLFVISHDDTFETVTDSIIRVTREA